MILHFQKYIALYRILSKDVFGMIREYVKIVGIAVYMLIKCIDNHDIRAYLYFIVPIIIILYYTIISKKSHSHRELLRFYSIHILLPYITVNTTLKNFIDNKLVADTHSTNLKKCNIF